MPGNHFEASGHRKGWALTQTLKQRRTMPERLLKKEMSIKPNLVKTQQNVIVVDWDISVNAAGIPCYIC